MPRQIVTEQRLIARLNKELAQGKNCREHTVSAVMRIDQQGNGGCNWAISVMSCIGSCSSAGNREAEKIIEMLQGLYNLHEEASINSPDFGRNRKVRASA